MNKHSEVHVDEKDKYAVYAEGCIDRTIFSLDRCSNDKKSSS